MGNGETQQTCPSLALLQQNNVWNEWVTNLRQIRGSSTYWSRDQLQSSTYERRIL